MESSGDKKGEVDLRRKALRKIPIAGSPLRSDLGFGILMHL